MASAVIFFRKDKAFEDRQWGRICKQSDARFPEILRNTALQNSTPFSTTDGVSERLNRTLLEMARAMMADSEFPKHLWAEAMSAACYINIDFQQAL